MAAVIQKNEITSTLRQVDIGPIWKDDQITIAPVSVDFVALGILYVTDPADPQHLKLGTGTCVNKRKRLVVADFTFTAASGTDLLTKVAHGLLTGDGPIEVSNSGGALPAPLVTAPTEYWVIAIDADTFKLAATLADAYSTTPIDITTNGTGTQTLSDKSTTQRGIPGEFVYTFTQAETNVDVTELWVLIDGGDYDRPNGGGKATANLGASTDGWDLVSGDGLTNQQKLNLAARFAGAKFTKVGNVYTWRDLADSKDSHSMTVLASGRTVFTIIDLD
jgi:hypothetical protein